MFDSSTFSDDWTKRHKTLEKFFSNVAQYDKDCGEFSRFARDNLLHAINYNAGFIGVDESESLGSYDSYKKMIEAMIAVYMFNVAIQNSRHLELPDEQIFKFNDELLQMSKDRNWDDKLLRVNLIKAYGVPVNTIIPLLLEIDKPLNNLMKDILSIETERKPYQYN